MSRENYSSEPEEFIASLKEKLDDKEIVIRELQTQVKLLKGINEELQQRYRNEQKVNIELFNKVMTMQKLLNGD